MIIPSIDIMGGKAVQLVGGKRHVLTALKNPVDLAEEFNRYGEVAVIDLDAALGQGSNLDLIRKICSVADVRVGGGIRTPEHAEELLRAGAKKLIIGTRAEPDFLKQFNPDHIIVALDHIDNRVLDKGWTRTTDESVIERSERLAPYCSGYLCTFVKAEGAMTGMDPAAIKSLKEQLPHQVTVAGGASDTDDVVEVLKLNVDLQVGMSLYTGELDLAEALVESTDFSKSSLIPTIVTDEFGQVLMLAYSNRNSLGAALREGKGIYWSRSRRELWEKGKTSGNTQSLISFRIDCDRDTLLFKVRQTGPACHTDGYSCFGGQNFSLDFLFTFLEGRKSDMPKGSFTAKLFDDRKLLMKKIREETAEVVNFRDRRNLVWEIADLFYFLSVLAVDENISFEEITSELGGRHR